jgi:hypothetical protein
MSKHINVNPGQYKVAGRERMGEPLGQSKDKARMSKSAAPAVKKKASSSKKGR